MKNKIWILQLPIVGLFLFLFWTFTEGEKGKLRNETLRNKVYPALRSFEGRLTNLKFKFRGPIPPKNKIVIVSIDDYSLENVGRWPWSRQYQAALLRSIFMAGAKVVGLDYVNSEPEVRMNPELEKILTQKGYGNLINLFDADVILKDTIQNFSEKLVLGWAMANSCQPVYFTKGSERAKEDCPIDETDYLNAAPKHLDKFAYTDARAPANFDFWTTPLTTIYKFLPNLSMHNEVARHAGLFDIDPDPDGVVRRSRLAYYSLTGKPLPTLALEMARVGLGEDLGIKLNESGLVEEIKFLKSDRKIPVNAQGGLDINFRGPGFSFLYVTAVDLLAGNPTVQTVRDRKIASLPLEEALKDAYVLVGITAQAVFDMRNYPFDSNVAGVEGHANILDNLLSGDALRPVTAGTGTLWMFVLMALGLLIAFTTERLSSIPGLLLFLGAVALLWGVDFHFLFAKQYTSWPTSLLYGELLALFVITMAIKYVLEEKDKKFLKSAFAKYVAPAVVESLVKDPKKLSLGGEKKDLTIMFSDVRNFTTLSEKMDAPNLAKFLNDYLGDMTQLVFKHKGTLDKYIGDAIMAFWGAPVACAEHSLNSVLSAIEMQKRLNQERERYLKDYGVDIQVGIGIHTGVVNVGNMGSKDNFNYTVIGDDVNLASRLEGLTKFYGVKILTTRATIDEIKTRAQPLPPHRALDLVKVKGKTKPVEIIQVLDEELPQDSLDLFAEARIFFSKRDFKTAQEAFRRAENLLKLGSGRRDGPCQMYIERCDEFLASPPPKDWDGSLEMRSK